MKKNIVSGIIFMFLISSVSFSFAAKDQKGASAQAVENASENSVFNRMSDWFSTVGKSDAEKKQILEERKAKRAAERTRKMEEKKMKKAEKEMNESIDMNMNMPENIDMNRNGNMGMKMNRGSKK